MAEQFIAFDNFHLQFLPFKAELTRVTSQKSLPAQMELSHGV